MLLNDTHHAVRRLIRDRWLTLGVLLILAVPTGVNTAVFSLAQTIALQPFAIPELHRVVTLAETIPRAGPEPHNVSPGNFLQWAERVSQIDRLSAYRRTPGSLLREGDLEPVSVHAVSDTFFSTLNVHATLGRTFRGGETDANHVVLSDRLWRRLGGAPDVVGQALVVNGVPVEVIGVMPKTFDFPMSTDMWMPLIFTPDERRDWINRSLSVVGRLASQTSPASAQREMDLVMARLVSERPVENAGRAARVTLLRDSVNPNAKQFLIVLALAAGFALLLACANVANLQLARGATRQTETAIRLSLGATRWTVFRGLLIEGALLGAVAAALGLQVAQWTLALIKALATGAVARNVAGWNHVGIDAPAALFAALVGVLAGLAVVLPTTFQLANVHLIDTLKASGRSSGRSLARRFRSSLVVAEVAIAAAMLVGSSLMIKAFERLSEPVHGYDPSGLTTLRIALPERSFPTDDTVVNTTDQMLNAVGHLSGVRRAAAVSHLPSLGGGMSMPVTRAGQDPGQLGEQAVMEVRMVSDGYFETMNIPIQAGRSFTVADRADTLTVAIVSESAARRLWPGVDSVEQFVRLGGERVLRVIGVVSDVNHFILDRAARPTVYLPIRQRPIRTFTVVARADHSVSTVGAIREAVRQVDPAQELFSLGSMQTTLQDISGGVRLVATLLTVIAALALLVAAAGVYAVVSYLVVLRQRDIAIRVALGAQRTDVFRLFGVGVGKLALAGVIIGAVAGGGIGRVTERALTIISVETTSLVASGAIVLLASLVAIYVPVRRASVDRVAKLLR